MIDDDDIVFDRYMERAEATLAYRLMEYLEFLGVITDEHVCYLRYPPIELIEDAEAALKDAAMTDKDDMIIRAAARIICAGFGRKRESLFKPTEYISGDGDHTVWMRLAEQGIRKGIKMGKIA